MRKAGGSARFVAFASLLLLVVLAFVEASVIDRQKREFVIPDWIEIVDEPVHAENSKTIQRAVRVRDAKVTYDGAQVWRVRSSEGQKDLLSNVTTDFQDTGLPSLWTRNDTTVDVMVRLEEIPRLSRYLKQKDLEYQVVIENLQKAIDEANPSLSEQEMEELEGRKATQRSSEFTGGLFKEIVIHGGYFRRERARLSPSTRFNPLTHFRHFDNAD
ncbi:hypothetical protein K0M31_009419 [Melipona bicolor]|uniref:Carboxypeptidase activation peptide domain-containing protein n=1 Tax=Melipona bicolor TaxID=60889 RepID=A0AA40KJ08_9HYME|nr:hypothetical protein K0M31_009419 [Melipona bicolor]